MGKLDVKGTHPANDTEDCGLAVQSVTAGQIIERKRAKGQMCFLRWPRKWSLLSTLIREKNKNKNRESGKREWNIFPKYRNIATVS